VLRTNEEFSSIEKALQREPILSIFPQYTMSKDKKKSLEVGTVCAYIFIVVFIFAILAHFVSYNTVRAADESVALKEQASSSIEQAESFLAEALELDCLRVNERQRDCYQGSCNLYFNALDWFAQEWEPVLGFAALDMDSACIQVEDKTTDQDI